MLRSLTVENFTAFPSARFEFAKNVNVLVGENGSGKTHVLKLAYTAAAVSWEESRKAKEPTKSLLQSRLADKLLGVFRPEALGRLTRRRQGRERCDVQLVYEPSTCNLSFRFASNSKSEVQIERSPTQWSGAAPVYIPTRELLSLYPGFVPIYEGHYLEFEETWRDTCILLGAPLQKGPKAANVTQLLEPLERALGGTVELEKTGRFYLRSPDGRMEMPLVAEGLRKLAMLARLVATGALMDKGSLFWDEPEANLNPKLIKSVARSLIELSKRGLQIFVATHSLFFMRELEILLSLPEYTALRRKFFGLHRSDAGVELQQGAGLEEIGDISSLDEELEQSDRYIETTSRA